MVRAVREELGGRLLVAAIGSPGIDAGHPSTGVAERIQSSAISPLREHGAVTRGHVLNVFGHLHGQVVLRYELRVAVLQLNQLLLKLEVALERVRIVRGIVDETPELGRRGANREAHYDQNNDHPL